MPRVHHVKHARKTYRGTGIKKGQPYYWWKFRRGPKVRSTAEPKPSQLTQSPFWSSLLSAQEALEEGLETASLMSDLKDTLDSYHEALDSLLEETQQSLENVQEYFQGGDVVDTLQERVDGLEQVISEVTNVDVEVPEDEEEEYSDEFNDKKVELEGLEYYQGS